MQKMASDAAASMAEGGFTLVASITIFIHVFSLAPLVNKCVESYHCTHWGPSGADIGYPLTMSMLQLACVGLLLALVCAIKSFFCNVESSLREERESRCCAFHTKAMSLGAAGAAFGIKYGLHTNAIRRVSVSDFLTMPTMPFWFCIVFCEDENISV